MQPKCDFPENNLKTNFPCNFLKHKRICVMRFQNTNKVQTNIFMYLKCNAWRNQFQKPKFVYATFSGWSVVLFYTPADMITSWDPIFICPRILLCNGQPHQLHTIFRFSKCIRWNLCNEPHLSAGFGDLSAFFVGWRRKTRKEKKPNF